MYQAAFSGFAVDDLEKARKFYGDVLGLEIEDMPGMGIHLVLPSSGAKVFVYAKEGHKPADYTMLNLIVKNIDQAIEQLTAKGIHFEHYQNLPAPQDAKGVLRGLAAGMGPDIAWFKDPAGNTVSVLQRA